MVLRRDDAQGTVVRRGDGQRARRGVGQSMAFDPSSIPRPPAVWSYTLDGGWVAWAGRTARDNDHLSLKVARNDDWWFHV